MARKNRFEMVLSDEEYAKLEEVAKAAGISKGAYVRSRLFPGGLDPERIEDVRSRLDKARSVQSGRPPKPEVFRMVEERVAEAEVNDDKAFKRKVAQIMGKTNCSQTEAEEKVRG